jgi:peroxisomal membrane protein 4
MYSGFIDEWINNPDWHSFLAILKGMRNGLVYGTKVRFPHSLVMTFLFRDGGYKSYITQIG